MSAKNIIGSILFLMLFFLISCEKTISDFEIEKHPPLLVLKGIFYKDSLTTINLSSTVSVDENSSGIPVVDGALVNLYENGKLIDRMQTKGSGDYSLNHYPLPGARYRIEVEMPGFKSIHAEMTMPGAFSLDEVTSKILLNQQDPDCVGCTPYNAMEITLSPSASGEDSYVFISSLFEDVYEINCIVSQCVSTTHPEYEYEYDSCYCVEADTFSINDFSAYLRSKDARIDFLGANNNNLWLAETSYESYGQELYLRFDENITDWPISIMLNEYDIYKNQTQEITVITGNCSEEAYQFLYSLARINEVEYNPLAEKVSVYTNVVNGKGIFAGIALETFTIGIDSRLYHE